MKILQIIILVCSSSLFSAEQLCEKEIHEAEFQTLTDEYVLNELDVLAIWSPVHAGSYNVPKVCSSHTGLPIERQCFNNRHAADATWDAIDRGMELLDCNVIANYCDEESFEHLYLKRNNVVQKHTNKWPAAKIGELAKTKDRCLLNTGLPLTRKCMYNARHYVAEWEKKDFTNIKCLWDIKQEIVTNKLDDLYKEVEEEKPGLNNINAVGVAARLTNLLIQAETVRIAADLEVSTNILKVITSQDKDPALMPKVLQVTNLLMQSVDSVVFTSTALNTPNTLLETVEDYFDGMTKVLMPRSNCFNVPDGVRYFNENLTSAFYINPACSNISGIAVYNKSVQPSSLMHYDRPTNTFFRYLYLNQSEDDIMIEPNLEAAGFLPHDVWTALVQKAAAGKSNLPAVRFSLYRNGNFFVDRKHNEKTPASVVLKMSIPGYTDDLPGYVPLIFQHSYAAKEEKTQCGHYDTRVSTWYSAGVADKHLQNVALCKTYNVRTTSFGAFLRLSRPRVISDSAVLTIINGSTQDIVSIAGCGLSLFGLMCIWLTALCCKQWRSQSSNLFLLNICLVLTLLMAYFLFINMPEIRDAVIDTKDALHCIAEGAFLQYTVLVLFHWMLIIAILQYHRYVTVVGTHQSQRKFVIYFLAGWGLPLIPTSLVIHLDPKSYKPFSEKGEATDAICYPSGRSFYYAMLLPITIIIVVNVFFFLYIMCSIRRSLNKFKHSRERKNFIAQVRLWILLFFLLGISWLFGILAHLEESGVFSFLFCLTSTLQGFILFIYFVAFDNSARHSWLKCICGDEYYILENTTMTRMTAVNSQRSSQ